MTDEPDQKALYCIEGPGEDGSVWICSAKGREIEVSGDPGAVAP
jgi:hypothetical protein